MNAHQIHIKNIWMLKLLVGLFIVASVLQMLVHRHFEVAQPILGASLLLVLAGFVVRRRWPRLTMILTLVMLFIYLNVMVFTDLSVTNYIFLGLLPLLSLMYHHYLAVAVAGALHLLSMLYLALAYRGALLSGKLERGDAAFFVVYGLFILSFCLIYVLTTKMLSPRTESDKLPLNDILESASVGVWAYDLSKMELEVSSGFEQITGYSKESLKGRQVQEIIYPADLKLFLEIQHELILRKTNSTKECRIVRPDGEIRWFQNRARPYFNNHGHLVRLEGVVIDITERKQLEEKIQFLAYHDELTGLANRAKFYAKYAETQGQGEPVALMFLDLDNFKEVNDTYGHEAGDELLKNIAGRLVTLVRAEDMVCRLGGDEFVILLVGLQEDGVLKVLDRIRSSLAEGYVYRGRRISISASIGISLSPDGNASLEDMLRLADATMYDVKRGGDTIRMTADSGLPLPS